MGKVPIRLREVVYTLSPFEQTVMNGLWKDVVHKISHQFQEKAFDITVFGILPVWGTIAYAKSYKEGEKMEHRY